MILYIILTIVCAIVFYNATDYFVNNYSKASKLFNTFKEEWKVEGEYPPELNSVTGSYEDTLVISNTIPKDFKQGDIICVRFAQENFRVLISGSVVYECRIREGNFSDKIIAKRWHFINLKNVVPGDKITIELHSKQTTYSRGAFSTIYGNLNSVVAYMLKRILVNLNLSAIALLSGVFMLINEFLVSKKLDKSYIYIGMFFIGFGVWSFTNIRLSIMPEVYSTAGLLLENFTLIFNSIIYLLYIREKYHLKEVKILKWYIYLCCFYLVIWLFIQIFRSEGSINLTVFSVALTIVNILLEVSWVTYRSFVTEKSNFVQWMGIFIVTQCSILEVMLYINNKFYFSGLYIRVGVIIYLITQLIITFNEVNQKLKNKAIIKQQLEDSRIALMTRQMEPHFFSNALIAIQDLCYTNPEKAADSIALFYSYLRTNMIYANQDGLISFKEERKIIKMYIEIQKLCFGDEIEFEEYINFQDFLIPSITIQPFIENAVKHGVRKRRGIGRIKLSVYKNHEEIIIQVEDNGVGFDTIKLQEFSSGFSSTKNIIYRLERQSQGKVTIDSKIGEGTIVTIKLPNC